MAVTHSGDAGWGVTEAANTTHLLKVNFGATVIDTATS